MDKRTERARGGIRSSRRSATPTAVRAPASSPAAQLQRLAEATADALVVVDRRGRIAQANAPAERLFGYAAGELAGKPVELLVPERLRARHRSARYRYAGAPERRVPGAGRELQARRRDGSELAVDIVLSPLPPEYGELIGAWIRDASDARRSIAELRAAQAYHRSLIEASADALFVTDPLGVVSDVNAAACTASGRERAALVGTPLSDLFGEPAAVETALRQALTGQRVSGCTLKLRTQGARDLAVRMSLSALRDDAGRLGGLLVWVRKPPAGSRRRRSGAATTPAADAGARHDEVRSLIEANPDALVITDPLGVITDVNRRMCAITGRGREELIGTPFATHCAHPAVATAVVRSALVEGGVIDRELRLRARDGREPTVVFSAGRLTGADGALRGLLAVARDIAPRKRLEEQLRQRNAELTETTALLDNVLQSSTEYSIIAQDLQGLILTWNEGARRLFGYSAEEVVGKGNAAWLHTPEDLAGGRVQAFLDQAFATGKAEAVFERRRKSGRRVPTSMSATLRRSADGRPIGYLLIATDLSEQKRLEEELRRKNEALAAQYRQIAEASRQKSAFLAHMSHELRTPLNAIIGFSELLFGGRAGTLQEKHRAFVGDILTSAQHLLQLIDDVLDLSKVEAGRMEFVAEAVDLERVVGEVCEVVGSLVSQHRMRLSVELDPRVNRVVADAGKLRQVLYNYLSNAIKFSPEGSTVVIRTRPEERRRFRLEVQDQGPGIRPQDMHRLFQEFQRLYADSRGSPGTGLGLALTKRLVEAQGGEVGVHSEYGHGSTFFAVLPMELAAGIVASPRPGAAIEPPQVLVVEDDAGRRAWITSTLTGAGYRVDTAATGAGARALCRERSYDAVAFDVQLPDQSGWELLHGLRALPHHARTPAVALCIGDDGLPSCAIAVSEHLLKPVSDDELEAALRRAGVRPSSLPLALLDADAAACEQMQRLLNARGYRTLPLASAAALPDLLARAGAQALIADLALLQSAAAPVLEALHELEQARGLPVLVCDGRDAPQRVPASGGTGAGARLVAELRRVGCNPLPELEH